jgi:hypothetical protein
VQPLKNYPTFYGTRRFITVFTRALYCSPSWARSIQSIPSHPISLRSTYLKRYFCRQYNICYITCKRVEVDVELSASRNETPDCNSLSLWCSVSLEMLSIAQMVAIFPKAHYHLRKTSTLYPILSQMNPLHDFNPTSLRSNLVLFSQICLGHCAISLSSPESWVCLVKHSLGVRPNPIFFTSFWRIQNSIQYHHIFPVTDNDKVKVKLPLCLTN